MLRLVYATEPFWLTLTGDVRVKVRPFTSAVVAAARARLSEGKPEDTAAERFVAFTEALAQVAIVEWDGVEDESGQKAPLSPEGVRALMDVWLIHEAFQQGYVVPGLTMGAEKKS